ncbi:hypothetical protein HELRODRAFT_175337 [Helobdella robusta]|uniref:Apple domain-containing protein n=1 Tax=Helobdella robusta TaxID=6412 RepID=T1F959_HELRO|nr:hypothetical protein HELRODRAFT_175337 [Helobdella robusta]ESO00844.1 hypothetical protein HELRODRAFT_175337 [Helobdella robusta]
MFKSTKSFHLMFKLIAISSSVGPTFEEPSQYKRIFDCDGRDICYLGTTDLFLYDLSQYDPLKILIQCSWICSGKDWCRGFDIRFDIGMCGLYSSLPFNKYSGEKCALYLDTNNSRSFLMQLLEADTVSVYVDGIAVEPVNATRSTIFDASIGSKLVALVNYLNPAKSVTSSTS